MKVWLVKREYIEDGDYVAFLVKEAAQVHVDIHGGELLTDPIEVAGLSDSDTRYLAHWARVEASNKEDLRYNQELSPAQRRLAAFHWRSIADALHPDPYGRDATSSGDVAS